MSEEEKLEQARREKYSRNQDELDWASIEKDRGGILFEADIRSDWEFLCG